MIFLFDMMKNDIYNVLILILTFVIAFSALAQYTSLSKQTDAIEGSYLPHVYYSNGKCPQRISANEMYNLTINFGNYGKIPAVDFFVEDMCDNIEIIQKYIGSEASYNERLEGVLLPIESKANKESQIVYSFIIKDKDVNYAELILRWGYSRKDGDSIEEDIRCYYEKEYSDFLIQEKQDSIVFYRVSKRE